MVTGIVRWQQPIGILWVAHHGVEVNHCVEISGRADPLIDGLPVGVAQGAGMVIT